MKTCHRPLILGLGTSGAAAARLLWSEGASVTVVDAASSDVLGERTRELRELGIDVTAPCNDLPRGDFDLAVVSPGIPESAPWIQALRDRGVPLMSELELAWMRRQCPVIAVTGSTGKSTATTLLAHILSRAGLRATPAGNLGFPLSAAVIQETDWLVVEVSSFQLEFVTSFRPDIGILLNLQPNHLDRHGSMEHYLELKTRLFRCTREQDLCLVQDELPDSVRAVGAGQFAAFGLSADSLYRYRDGFIYVDEVQRMDLRGTPFDNAYMGPMAAAVLAAANRAGVTTAGVVSALDSFEPLPHRMQRLACWEGVTFVNDSKSTCLSATAAALEMCGGPVRLIAGGVTKETDVMMVGESLRRCASAVYLIGESADTLAAAWGRDVPCKGCGDLAAAVRLAWQEATAGETILLSPGCASFDQFSGFAERGDRFREEIHHILGGEGMILPSRTHANAMDKQRTMSTMGR